MPEGPRERGWGGLRVRGHGTAMINCVSGPPPPALSGGRRWGGSMNKRPAREPYERPKVVRVRIVSGEMAVTGCKVRNGNVGPTLGCQRTACRKIGS